MAAEWVEYKGKKILLVKYAGLNPSQMLDLVKVATQMILDARSTQVLSLTDVTGCYVNKEFMDYSKVQGKISLQLTKKAAIVGVTGLKNVLLRALNEVSSNPRVPFDTVEQAMEWLVK